MPMWIIKLLIIHFQENSFPTFSISRFTYRLLSQFISDILVFSVCLLPRFTFHGILVIFANFEPNVITDTPLEKLSFFLGGDLNDFKFSVFAWLRSTVDLSHWLWLPKKVNTDEWPGLEESVHRGGCDSFSVLGRNQTAVSGRFRAG